MFRLGVAQIHNHFSYEANLDGIIEAMRLHAKRGTDLILLPECVVTGFNTGLHNMNRSQVEVSVSRIQKEARELKVGVVLPTPWPTESDKFLNAVFVIADDGRSHHQFSKVGLHIGEEKIFAPGQSQARTFDYRGLRIGLLICIEASHDPWTYLREGEPLDCILWPGFWGPRIGITWSDSQDPADLKIRKNAPIWGVPVIQSTCATSPESELWPDKMLGGSLVLDSTGKEIFRADTNCEAHFVVEFKARKIQTVVNL